MAKSKKGRKILIFSIIVLALIGLTVPALLKKREAIVTVQTEKVARRSLTEIVVANGKVQPVLQVKISAEVSGEIIEMPIKEGQTVQKGDLIVKIKPEFYVAQLRQAEAGYASAVAGKSSAEANLRKAKSDFKRSDGMWRHKLIPESDFDAAQAAYDVAQAGVENAIHQMEMAKASVDSARESLDKTTILAPLTGSISKLNSRLGERVLGTVQNVGTEIMTIADLNEMEARVDLGENDVVLIAPGQKARLEVDAFKDRKFTGTVTEIANSSKDSGASAFSGNNNNQEATKFEVRIKVEEKEAFRPGMSVTAEIETRYRTNALTVPFACVTSRLPKEKKGEGQGTSGAANTNSTSTRRQDAGAPGTNDTAAADPPEPEGTNTVKAAKKAKETPKPINVIFALEGDRVKMIPVKIGISSEDYWEITDGLCEGQEIVSGSYQAINRDLEDGKRIRKGVATGPDKDKGRK